MVTELRTTTWNAVIDGEEVAAKSGERFDTYDPATGKPFAQVARGLAADIDLAVESARRAFPAWSRRPPVERGRILMRIAEALIDNRDALAHLETLDNGKPISQSARDVDVAARYFEFYAGIADKVAGETIPLGAGFLSYTIREPFGVSAQIVPWNAPIQQAARGIAPALAAGNTAVVKPAEDTPLSCLELARLALSCDLPAGVLNVVPGYGEEAGAALVSHGGISKVTFTGSVETGRLVMRNAADRLLPLTLELGGKSPNIVFADGDLELAAKTAMVAINTNAGQVCSAGSRLLVEDSIYDEMVERVAAFDRAVTLGPGLEDPQMGPLTTEDQFLRVQGFLKAGVEEGARVAVGGGLPSEPRLRDGWFVQPTVFADVDNAMRIAQEEIFGPVLSVIRFRDENDAIRIANDSRYGLVAGVWTSQIDRGHRVAAALEVGQVFINSYFSGGVETPFGGSKNSGFGREKGLEAIHHYTKVKTVTLPIEGRS